MLHWHQLTGRQIEALDRDTTVVLVSCSPLEVHGPHLPTYADIREGEGLAVRATEILAARHPEITVVSLPWMYVAADVLPHSGSISFRPKTVALVVQELGESLGRQGFRHVWVSNFHAGPRHILALELGAYEAWRATGVGMISLFSLLVGRLTGGGSDLALLLGGIGDVPVDDLHGDAHAGLVETSLLLHLAGEHVDPMFVDLPPRSIERELDAAGRRPLQKGEKPTVVELLRALPIRSRYYERETYAGAPARASAELGAQYLERIAEEGAAALEEVYLGHRGPDDCHSPLWPMRRALMSERFGRLYERLVQTRDPGV